MNHILVFLSLVTSKFIKINFISEAVKEGIRDTFKEMGYTIQPDDKK